MQNLKPCPFRQVDGDGNILCDKIKSGDRAVSPNVCRACPIAAIHCAHLRATLARQTHPPVVVRYGNGKTEIWEDPTPPIALERAACAEKVMPILSPRDCAGCPLRLPLSAETLDEGRRSEARPPAARPTPRRTVDRPAPVVPPALAPVPAPVVAPRPPEAVAPIAAHQPMETAAQTSPTVRPAEAERSSIVAQKIIKLQEWLEKQKRLPKDEDAEAVRPITYGMPRSQAAPPVREEKRVGWTD